MAIELDALTGYRSPSGEITLPLPGSTLERQPAGAETVRFTGKGRLLTYSIVHVPTTRFKSQAPYVLAIIELDEGARLMGLVDGAPAGNLAIEANVRYSHRDEFGYHFQLVPN
ncbi:MAG: OB-fold domain-containing protein [Chloroflexi bacterium]|nr:OB-fold domain-containing protein [Chloroflexota bacterium]